MTRNQIEYAKLLESRRAAQAQESLTQARDEETARSHRAGEAISSGTLKESNRHNLAAESLEANRIAETTRSNRAKEQETSRSNKAKEAEARRSNLARELETNRSNVARETETHRGATASEAIRIGEAATRAGELAERVRHDLAMEAKNLAPVITVGGATVNATPVQNNTLSVPSNSVSNLKPNTSDATAVSNRNKPYAGKGFSDQRRSVTTKTLDLGPLGEVTKSHGRDSSGKPFSSIEEKRLRNTF